MSSPTSLFRPLLHRPWTSLAVIAGAATATAVLTGALVVGDSVRGSLRDLTLERLGGIDHAMVAQRFVRAELAESLAGAAGDLETDVLAAPAILLRGSVEHAERRTRATQVGIQGIEASFLAVFGETGLGDTGFGAPAIGGPAIGDTASFFGDSAGPFPPAVINRALAASLGAETGDAVLLHLKRWSEVPRSSLLGRKETESVVETVRLEIVRIIDDANLGRFSLAASQAQPLNMFVALESLADALDQPGEINAIVVTERDGGDDPQAMAGALDGALERGLAPPDIGLTVRRIDAPGIGHGQPVAIVESDELVLRPSLEDVAIERLDDPTPVLAYLANTIAVAGSDAGTPYSTIAALDPPPGSWRRVDGTPMPALRDDEILINAWLAEDLGIDATSIDREGGDPIEIRLDYFSVGPREALFETSTTLTLAGVVALEGLAADESLVQEVPGIAGSENMADWDPPFPVALDRVRTKDEDYWDAWRDTPKAFVNLATGRRLWETRWGDTTSLRAPLTPETDLDAIGRSIVEQVPRESFGLVFRPIKADSLRGSSGATDFTGLFLGFSIFLIISAAVLAALLFRLAVEQRAGEIGLLLAVGFGVRHVRRRLLGEGAILATAGAVLGTLGAVGFAAGVMTLLRTWWLPAVGTTALRLHVVPLTLALGAVVAILVVLLSILRTTRRTARVAPTALLRGVVEPADAVAAARPARRSRLIALVTGVLALGLLAVAFATASSDLGRNLFFAIGPLILVAGLAAFGSLRSGAAARPGPGATLRLGLANAGRHRGRSLLAAGLVAVATFMIVTVAAFEHDYSREDLGLESGSGGFTLVAESEIPLLFDPATEDGRFELGLPTAGPRGETLERATILPCRLLPGDDTSCLNLYKPTSPRIVGVPPALVERQAFRFTAIDDSLPDAPNPWTLLDHTFEDGAIPAIGDAASMQYILKLPLGGDLVMDDGRGGRVTLRLVGTLKTSIFQSEMLISDANFVRHFPQSEGFRYFLVDVPEADAESVGEILESSLAPYGLDAVSARGKLAAFHAVQNTYLSTFRTLGGLGLLLGTVGLAVVMLRNIDERRAELAAMRAFGFRRRWLNRMVVIENAILLVGGLALGTISALITVSPQLGSDGANVPWAMIAATLGAILAAGLVATVAVAAGALRVPLLPALKADH